MLFAFIFVGVTAFSTSDGFSSVINSILPAVAGLSMGARQVDHEKLFKSLSKLALVKIIIGTVVKKIIKAMRIA